MMKKNLVLMFLIQLLIPTFYLPNTFAQFQDYTQFSLPDGAKARLGKGRITGSSAISLDGTRYARQSSVGLWLYDVHSGFKEVTLLSNHLDNFTSFTVSSDGNMHVSRNSAEVSLWEIGTDNKVATLTENTEEITTMLFSPDSKVIAIASEDDTIRLWNTNTGKLLYLPLKGHQGDVLTLGFSPDSSKLASGSTDKTVRLWSVATGEHLATLEEEIVWGEITQEGHTDAVTAVSFSPDGNTLASGGADNKILLWDINAIQHQITFIGHTEKINAIVFSPDGTLLVSGSTDETIRFWNLTTGEHLDTLEGHRYDVIRLSYSSDGAILASVDSRNVVNFWDGYTGQHLETPTIDGKGYGYGVHDLAYVQNGTFLYSGEGSTNQDGENRWGRTRLWHTLTGEPNSIFTNGDMYVSSITLSPDGKTLVAVGQDVDGEYERYSCGCYGCWSGYCTCWGSYVKYCSRWKVTSRRYPLEFWNVQTGEHIVSKTGHRGHVSTAAFSPNGKILATGSWDNEIRMWNTSSGQHLITFIGHSDNVNTVVFSPDGETLASGSDDDTIKLWNSDGSVRVTLNGHADNVNSIAFTPDGKTLASGSSDGTIRLWDPITEEHIGTLDGHTEGISSVTFSADGESLASASWDNTIRLWDPITMEHLETFNGHKGDVNTVAFSPNGTTLASGSSDATILLWDLSLTDTPNVIPTTPTVSNSKVIFSPSTVPSPGIGENITFSLNIEDGVSVAGYQVELQYDGTALRFVESANSNYLPTGAFSIPVVVDENTITLASSSLSGESNGDGTLVTITFEVIAVKSSTVQLTNVILTDSSGGSLTPQTENAEITETPQLPEDVNKDGIVNIIDLTLVASNFGKTGTNVADVNGDGIVNIIDLTLVAAAFGNTAAAPIAWVRDSEIAPTRDQVEQWLQEARQLNITDPNFQRGILVLENLLKTFTPQETTLLPNYPNPFNPETWIPYQLSIPSNVTISIFSVDGTLIRRLDLGHKPIGIYQHRSKAAHWDGKNNVGEPVASGVYFYTFTSGDFSATRKMLIRK